MFNILSYALHHPQNLLTSVGPTLNEATFGVLGSSFDPKRDIGDLSGKVIFVTGGSTLAHSPVLAYPLLERLTACADADIRSSYIQAISVLEKKPSFSSLSINQLVYT